MAKELPKKAFPMVGLKTDSLPKKELPTAGSTGSFLKCSTEKEAEQNYLGLKDMHHGCALGIKPRAYPPRTQASLAYSLCKIIDFILRLTVSIMYLGIRSSLTVLSPTPTLPLLIPKSPFHVFLFCLDSIYKTECLSESGLLPTNMQISKFIDFHASNTVLYFFIPSSF